MNGFSSFLFLYIELQKYMAASITRILYPIQRIYLKFDTFNAKKLE